MAELMLGHILLMNFLVPVALVTARAFSAVNFMTISPRWIDFATVAQITTFWMWHLPPAMNWAMETSFGFALMSISLAGASIWFWQAVLESARLEPGRALLPLLVTGKLFCLLGILIAFAPRLIYGHESHLADQQFAGLVMLIACPLTYVLAAIIIAARWLAETDNRPGWQIGST